MAIASNRRLFVFVVGLLLVLNPTYLYPDGGHRVVRMEYEATELEGVPADGAIADDGESDILWCEAIDEERACILERRIGANGTMPVNNSSALRRGWNEKIRLSAPYDYVKLPTGFYEPVTNVSGQSVVLRLRPVERSSVAAFVARDYRGLPAVVQRAVDTGSASTRFSYARSDPPDRLERLADVWSVLVETDGTYYAVERVRYDSGWFFLHRYLRALRFTAIFLGGVLILWGVQRPEDAD